MNCISRILVILLLGAAVSVAADTVDPVFIKIAGPLTDPRAEVSSLVWHNDELIIMPQSPDIFGGGENLGFFHISQDRIDAYLEGRDTSPLEPLKVECRAPGLLGIIQGFDGLEAMGVVGDYCYFTVEAKEDTAMAGYLVSGRYDVVGEVVIMDMTRLTSIPLGLNIYNIAEESLLVDGQRLLTFSEANGINVNPEPRAKAFDLDLNYLGSLPFPQIEYRVTDTTAQDENGRFWVINYFYPPDRRKLDPAPDPESAEPGARPVPDTCVERLLELQLTADDKIVRTKTPPINLTLGQGDCRNWEAIVRYRDLGFLIMTDQYPGTLLAFVPYPNLE